MIIRWPGHIAAGRRIDQITSLVDLSATILDIAGADLPELTGTNLAPLLRGDVPESSGSSITEYFAVGAVGPTRMLRRGSHKLSYYHNEPLELFDLDSDPDELTNLANDNEHADIQQSLLAELLTDWDPDDLDRRIRASQRDRLLIAGSAGGPPPIPAWRPGSD
jgi:choline-sulfatase